MSEHKYWLETGLPDLATSARDWLDKADQKEPEEQKVSIEALTDQFQSHFHSQLFGSSRNTFPGLSQIGQCMRKLTYQANGYDGVTPPGTSKMSFVLGDTTEWFLLAAAINAGWAVDNTIFSEGGQFEVQLEAGGHSIPGHPDGLIDLGDTLVLVEIKSMKEWKFAHWSNNKCAFVDYIEDDEFVMEPGMEGFQFWENNLMQIHSYMRALREMMPDLNIRTLFWCLNKNSGWHENAEVRWNEKIWAQCKDRYDRLTSYADQDTLAPRPGEVKEAIDGRSESIKWPCGYCKFWKECMPEGSKRVTEKETGKLSIEFPVR